MAEAFPVYGRPRYPTAMPARRRENRERTSASARGYDHLWQKVRDRFIRSSPFCKFCEQVGRDATLADEVDHIVPLRDGGDRLKKVNLQSLCTTHHNGLKRQMETYAREHGCTDMLPEWCDDPTKRPTRFRRG